LDEPESALDFRYRYKILEILKKWIVSQKRSALVTLHDGTLALNYCDELLLLSGGSVLGTVKPKTDPIEKTEEMLSRIYGNISLQKCRGRDGREHIVMLKEEE
jgi:iron complex transport system ATP-binding protein